MVLVLLGDGREFFGGGGGGGGGGGLRVGMLTLPVTVANKGFEGSLVRSLLSMYCSHPGSN